MGNTIAWLVQTCKASLSAKYSAGEARAITHELLRHYLYLSAAELYINLNQLVDDAIVRQIMQALTELDTYRPLQYVLGDTVFYNLPFFVTKDVLIPRPETEELVDWVVKDWKEQSSPFTIADLGTGSGCIAVSLAHNLPQALVLAVDVSSKALVVAQQNAEHNKVRVSFIAADILNTNTFPLQQLDCIVSNPPYVMNKEKALMEHNVLDYEPHLALFVEDNDPLIFYKAIATLANNYLIAGGCVYLEINEQLPNETAELFTQLGFVTEVRNDINDKPRMIKARKVQL